MTIELIYHGILSLATMILSLHHANLMYAHYVKNTASSPPQSKVVPSPEGIALAQEVAQKPISPGKQEEDEPITPSSPLLTAKSDTAV